MNYRLVIALLLTFLTLVGCYLPISGRVIDAETQQPIEGAVVLVEWTKSHGLGEHWTASYKVAEIISEKDGRIEIPGCFSPFVSPPNITIYKRGYVAWNNQYVFPKSKQRTDFSWERGYVFKLEKFLSGYSYLDHRLFISGAAHLSLASGKKKKFDKYYMDSEGMQVQAEQDERDKSRR